MPADETEPLHTLMINSQGLGSAYRVVWNPPIMPMDFRFPMIEVTVTHIDWSSDEKKTYRHFTKSHSTYEGAMEELIDIALHPSMRDFVNRAIFEQWFRITKRNDDYQKARNVFLKRNPSTANLKKAGLDEKDGKPMIEV